ncbi:hypothetical protein [Paraglaciecola sp.]|uniref:hypothetical protein n=1 Tax=Paraglaciecola sp. TaxID=1920173 RepID=UPI0030F3D610
MAFSQFKPANFSGATSYVIWRSEGLEVKYKDFNFTTSAQAIKIALKEDTEQLLNEREQFEQAKQELEQKLQLINERQLGTEAQSEALKVVEKTIQDQKTPASKQIQRLQDTAQNIDNLVPTTAPSSLSSQIVFDSYWAKAGYFLQLGDGVILNVNSVTDTTVTIVITGGIENKMSVNDSVLHKSANGVTYKITLLRIDNAGFNRFTKAGYFKVETL